MSNTKLTKTGLSPGVTKTYLSIPKIAAEGKKNDRETKIRRLEFIEDYVFGAHNASYADLSVKLHKHRHMNRIKVEILILFAKEIRNHLSELDSMTDFDEIYEAVLKISVKIKGISFMCVYDTTLRYCVNRNIYPKFVYLCANGPLLGAKGYFDKVGKKDVEMHDGTRKSVSKLRIGDKVKKDNFDTHFSGLSSLVIECVLCDYHEDLTN